MTKRRGTLLFASIVVLASTAGGGLLYQRLLRLPAPETADRDGLFRWLVTCDLSDQPQPLRHRLIARLEKELDAGIDFGAVDARLQPAQNTLLWQNIELLVEDWFRIQAERFEQATPETQQELLAREITKIESWGLAERLVARGAPSAAGTAAVGSGGGEAAANEQHDSAGNRSAGNRVAMWSKLDTKMQAWVQRTAEPQRPRVERFASAVRAYYAQRALRSVVSILTEGE